mgnify:CR=1 FL=1
MMQLERASLYRGRTPDGPVTPHKAYLGPVTKVLGGRGGRFWRGGEVPFSRKVPSPPSKLSINTNQNQLHDIAEALLEGGELHAGVGEFGDAGALALDDFGGGAADETLVGELLVEAAQLLSILPSSFSRRASSAAKSTAPDRCTMTSQPCATWLAEALGASPSASMMSSPRRASVRMTSRFASRTSFWWASDGRAARSACKTERCSVRRGSCGSCR